MTGGEDRPIDLDVRGGGGGARPDDRVLDALDLGSSGMQWLGLRRYGIAGLACAALIVGAALAGYYVGSHGAQTTSGTTAPNGDGPTTRLLVGGPGQPPTVTGNRCSAQIGAALQLGLEIVNPATTGTTLQGVEVQLPLGGLSLTRIAWGSCGQLSATDGADPHPLPAGATAWLTMTFDVQVPCPAPLPVQVMLRYAQADRTAVTPLGGFSDLGDVPYTGCREGPG